MLYNLALPLQQQPCAALVGGVSQCKVIVSGASDACIHKHFVWRMVFGSFGQLMLSSWVSVAGTANPLVQTSTWVVGIY